MKSHAAHTETGPGTRKTGTRTKIDLQHWSMQKGFNSDIQVRGKTYHIQTEDWGLANPFLVSRVFAGGAVLKTIKTPYDEALKTESLRNIDAVQSALKKQHNRICDLVFQGQLA